MYSSSTISIRSSSRNLILQQQQRRFYHVSSSLNKDSSSGGGSGDWLSLKSLKDSFSKASRTATETLQESQSKLNIAKQSAQSTWTKSQATIDSVKISFRCARDKAALTSEQSRSTLESAKAQAASARAKAEAALRSSEATLDSAKTSLQSIRENTTLTFEKSKASLESAKAQTASAHSKAQAALRSSQAAVESVQQKAVAAKVSADTQAKESIQQSKESAKQAKESVKRAAENDNPKPTRRRLAKRAAKKYTSNESLALSIIVLVVANPSSSSRSISFIPSRMHSVQDWVNYVDTTTISSLPYSFCHGQNRSMHALTIDVCKKMALVLVSIEEYN